MEHFYVPQRCDNVANRLLETTEDFQNPVPSASELFSYLKTNEIGVKKRLECRSTSAIFDEISTTFAA